MIELKPISLRLANDFLDGVHRHNGRTQRDGGKFAISVIDETGEVRGIAIVGNPLSATLMDGKTAEVTRVCTKEDAPKGVCSMLYSACWRAWRSMGGDRMVTYTLKTESGISLRASNWVIVGETKPVKDGWRKKDHLSDRETGSYIFDFEDGGKIKKEVIGSRTHSSVMLEPKFRWQPSGSRGT